MSGCFVDTTVLVDVVEEREPGATAAQQFAKANAPAQLPQYALREFLAGRIGLLCDVHNRMLAADNVGEALVALLKMPPVQGRTLNSKQLELATTLTKVLSPNKLQTAEDNKREILLDLQLRIARYWRRARKISVFKTVQPLACVNLGEVVAEEGTDVLKGPNGHFSCNPASRCAAAMYLYQHQVEIRKLIDALQPDNLEKSISSKQETVSRRKALKDLLNRGPDDFDKRRCRALGDAYFALMSPAGFTVLTTNLSDHVPLCEALGKVAASPP